ADFGDLDARCPLSSNFEPTGFTDVATNDFFYEPVNWMAQEQITTGTAPGIFSPRDPVTRAQAATFIWRFMGEPEPVEPSGFDDIPDAIWYTSAVAWMKQQGITTGTSPTEFTPNGVVTRAQLAAFLYGLAGEPEVPPSDQFDDVEPGRFYTDAVAWMVLHEITAGTSPTTFEPDSELTRGQLATFLWRLAGTPEAFADGIELPAKMRV
ncbi:MAG: S-layer homology domain-containing protein, partial [Actinomycetota bacterium]